MKPSHTMKPARRRFLKTAAMSGAALAPIASIMNVHAAGTGMIKVGLIGCGGRGLGAANEALNTGKDVKLVAAGDYFKDRAKRGVEALQRQYKDQVEVADDRIFDGFQNDLGVINSDADVILIACAAKFHPLYTLHALQAGKHVFCEKPNAIDPYGISQLEESVQLAKQKNLSFLCGLHSRFHKPYQEIFARIHDGAIGSIKTIQSNYLRSPYGVRSGYPPDISELDFQVWSQYMFNWLSGDDFTQSLVHNVDRMIWALDGQLPAHAFGMGGRASMTERKYGNVFDHHAAVFVYPDDALRYFAYCRTETGCYNNEDDLIIGTKGTAYIGGNNTRIKGETNWQYKGDKPSPHREEQVALFNGVRNGQRIHSDGYVVKSTSQTVLGQFASYTGQMLVWDDFFKTKFFISPKPEDCKAEMNPPAVLDPQTGSYPTAIPGKTKWW